MNVVQDKALCWSCARTVMPKPIEFDDEQLRAECERRGLQSSAEDFAFKVCQLVQPDRGVWVYKDVLGAILGLKCDEDGASEVGRDRLRAERDEWRRRAAIAEADGYLKGQAEMRERWSKFSAREAMRTQESGHGIAVASPVAGEPYPHDTDLLCEDA